MKHADVERDFLSMAYRPQGWPRVRLLLRKPEMAWVLLKAAVSKSFADNIQRMSAALAYYTIFSLAPLLVIAIAIAGAALGEKAARGEIVEQIQTLIGREGARAIQTMIQSAHRPTHSAIASAIGIVTLFLGATTAFSEVYDALNIIWSASTKAGSGLQRIVKARFLSFGVVLMIGFLLLVSLVISAALAGIAKFAENSLPAPAAVLHCLDFLFSLAVIAVLFAMIFKMLPEVKIAWSDVWIGAGLTAFLFDIGKVVIGFYIGKSVPASSYGAAGSIVIIAAWIYYSALLLYFGAEFTEVYAHEFGSRMNEGRKGVTPQAERTRGRTALRPSERYTKATVR